jgi:hypothetical protein
MPVKVREWAQIETEVEQEMGGVKEEERKSIEGECLL